jgi:multidrug resistance efflux pump
LESTNIAGLEAHETLKLKSEIGIGDRFVTPKLFTLLPVLAVIAAATSAHSQNPAAATRKIDVEEALVTAIDEVEVPATETGMLTVVHVKEGQSTEKDALLAEIDNRATLAKQRIAKGEWDAAVAQAENEAEVEVAQKAIEVSKAELDSITEIRKKNPGAVSETEKRKYVFQYEKAIAQEKQAINERLIAAKTAMAKQAQYDATSVDLDLRQIKAPFRGQVVELYKKPGEWVQSGEKVMHFVGLDRVRVSGFVLASLVSPYELIGKPVTITVSAAGEKKHTVKGTIGFASPIIEGTGLAHQFRVWAQVDNEKIVDPLTKQESWKIQPGSMANMTIDLTPPPPAKPATPTKAEPAKGAKSSAPPTKSGTAAPADGKSAPPPAKNPPSATPGQKRESLKPVVNEQSNSAAPSSKER